MLDVPSQAEGDQEGTEGSLPVQLYIFSVQSMRMCIEQVWAEGALLPKISDRRRLVAHAHRSGAPTGTLREELCCSAYNKDLAKV